jgi:hypothetical protein
MRRAEGQRPDKTLEPRFQRNTTLGIVTRRVDWGGGDLRNLRAQWRTRLLRHNSGNVGDVSVRNGGVFGGFLVTKRLCFERHTIQLNIYSAFNHKRATAAKCRESHHLRSDATTAVPFPDSGGVTHGILQRWRAYD